MSDRPDVFRFDELLEVAGEHAVPIASAHGRYNTYALSVDRSIDPAERGRLSDLGKYDDRPEDYKVHINPEDDQLFPALMNIVELCRQSRSLREAIYNPKVWIGGTEHEYDDLPRLVLYARNGYETNALTIVREVLPSLGGIGINGSGLVPRFNLPIVEGFCYIAQGGGTDKQEDPFYRKQFDPDFNHALLDAPSGELEEMIKEIEAKL